MHLPKFKTVLGVSVALLILVLGGVFFLSICGSTRSHMTRETITIGQVSFLDACLQEYCKDCSPKLMTNRQFADALIGNNSAKKEYIFPWSLPRNSSGELIDSWGDAFVFKQKGDTIVASSRHVPDKSYVRNWPSPN